MTTYSKEYYQANKERISAWGKVYRESHKEEAKAYRDSHKIESKAWRTVNKESIKKQREMNKVELYRKRTERVNCKDCSKEMNRSSLSGHHKCCLNKRI